MTQAILLARTFHGRETLDLAMLAAARRDQAECMSALLAAEGRYVLVDCPGYLTPLQVSAAFGSVKVRPMLIHHTGLQSQVQFVLPIG